MLEEQVNRRILVEMGWAGEWVAVAREKGEHGNNGSG